MRRAVTAPLRVSAGAVTAASYRLQSSESLSALDGSDATDAADASAPSTKRVPYRKRSSDPQTLRERMDFRRDRKYGRYRPLPDVPWRQHKVKTYLDDAERLYGRKETWHTVQDEGLREKLVTILQDYVRDATAAARLEARDARKYQRLCEQCAREYRASVTAGAFGSAAILRDWARTVVNSHSRQRTSGDGSTETLDGQEDSPFPGTEGAALPTAGVGEARSSGDVSGAPDMTAESAAEERARERMEERRRRGQEADLEGSAALSGLPERDGSRPQSAFPFLRQRAVHDAGSLDSSLVDWTAKYFPEDDEATFREPPRLRQWPHGAADDDLSDERTKGGEDATHAEGEHHRRPTPTSSGDLASSTAPRHHARHRLQRSLRVHEDQRRATFDAEGVFYHIRQQSEEDERAPRPKPVRGSDISSPSARANAGVVKVPWNVVAKSKQPGYTADILRAKERLLRLSRGEDPETIP